MAKYVCERCGGQDEKGWTDYYVRVDMGLPLLCAGCDPHQRCHWHNEAERTDAGETTTEMPGRK
jgi:hypothetical protein